MTQRMFVELNASPTPPYEQIRSQIESMIISGVLPVGTRLPTIRQLANDLGLAVNTVARAYRELETTGLVVTRTRSGTTVSPHPPQLPVADIRQRAHEAARQYLATTRSLGLTPEDAIATLRDLASQSWKVD